MPRVCAVPVLTSCAYRSTICVASVAAAVRAEAACTSWFRPMERASAARSSCETASDSERRTPAAGTRLVAAPASATAVPSGVTVKAAPAGA